MSALTPEDVTAIRSALTVPFMALALIMFVLPLSRPLAPSRRAASMASLSDVVDRLFDDSTDRFFPGDTAPAEARTPAMDVTETDGTFSVAFDAPGASREQLRVLVEGRRVVLSTKVAESVPVTP